MKPLKRGMTLPDFKYGSLSTTKIERLAPPRFVTFSLDSGFILLEPTVKEGDDVLVGTKIAAHSSYDSVPLHSSVSGRVVKVSTDSILIESNEADQRELSIRHEIPTEPSQIIQLIREAGIVDLGGSGFPTHLRLHEAREKQIHTLVINGCESEPFLTSDHVLMVNHAVEILKGTEALRLASGAKRAVIAVERNKLEAVEILNTKNYHLKFQDIETAHLPVRYPQGSERALAESVLEKKLGPLESALDCGVLVENVATAFAVYEAVYLNKPLYERVVTVAGPCVIEPKNVWARIGTRSRDLFRSAKGLLRKPARVLLGGPLTGKAIADLDVPITKQIPALLALSDELLPKGSEQACTRCARCVDVCPESLIPEKLMKAVVKENQSLALQYRINSCTECGLCAYVCPSHIPLTQLIHSGKTSQSQPSGAPSYATLLEG